MTLSEYLKEFQPTEKIRIGAEKGSGWFYAGIAEIDWDKLNKFAISRNQNTIDRIEFVDLRNREVTDHFISARNMDVTNIVIEGREYAKENDDAISADIEEFDKEGIENLAIAIIRAVMVKLRSAYAEFQKAPNSYLRSIWKEKIIANESALRESDVPEMIGASPEGLIRMARKELMQ